MLKLKNSPDKKDKQKYWELNPPRTQGDLEEAASAGLSWARAELDRQQGAGGGGGGAGITGLPQVQFTDIPSGPTPMPSPDPGAGDDPTFKPGVDPENPWGIPSPYAGFYDSPFNIPNPGASAAVVTPVTLPSGEVIQFGNPYIADQFQQYMASQTQTPATTPTPFDYSPWPQFGPAGGPVPNYVNQGLGQGPHFDYWNQIARTFPGMT